MLIHSAIAVGSVGPRFGLHLRVFTGSGACVFRGVFTGDNDSATAHSQIAKAELINYHFFHSQIANKIIKKIMLGIRKSQM